MTLKRLVLEFGRDGIRVRALYERHDGPGPGTKSRAREVTELTRTGLERALTALEGHVDVIGTSGYEVREDVIGLDGRAA